MPLFVDLHKSYSWIYIKAQLKRQTFQHKGTDNAHTWVVRVSIRADQHTDRGTCLFRGFRKIEQRMWPPTTSFGAGWSTSSVKSYETVPA